MQRWPSLEQNDALDFHDVGHVACSLHKGMGVLSDGVDAVVKAGGFVRHATTPMGNPRDCCEVCIKGGRCDLFEYDFEKGSCALIQLNDRGSYLGLKLAPTPNSKISGVVIVNECTGHS
jgi:hypothetical protein